MVLRAGLHHGPWSRTVKDDLLPWSDFMVQFLGSDFLENQFIKLLGPSLGVNGMWTKRNDHAPKSECVGFSNICLERVVLKNKIQVWPFFCILLLLSSIPPKKSLKSYYKNISLSWALPFSTRPPLLPLPLQNSLDHVSGWCRPWNMSFGDLELHGHFDILFLGVNQSGPRMTSWSMV
jgi:hypothetical protein